MGGYPHPRSEPVSAALFRRQPDRVTLAAATLVATPLLAFVGALLGDRWTRKSAIELDRWRKREETMRMLRWACELATESDPRRQFAGLAALEALLDSPLLDVEDERFVFALAGHVTLLRSWTEPDPGDA